jgi:KDO2-lipid IV(A) lauroyltransferase
MAKERNALVDYFVYVIVRVGACIIQSLTPRATHNLGVMMGWILYWIDRRHRRVAAENLRLAFPEKSALERDRLVRGSYRHFSFVILEIARLPLLLRVGNWRRRAELIGGDQILGRLTAGKSLLIVTGHFGNWELAGYVLGLVGMRTYAVARPIDNPYLDRFVRQLRERTGQRILTKKGDFDRMQELLQQGAVIATLGDQDAGARGLFVEFFNRPASTHKAIALMALEFNVPLLVVGTPKIGEPMKYQIVAEDCIDPAEYAGQPDAIAAITQRFTSALESIIRRYPEQYFWQHRRWKHQPRAKTRAA